MTADEANRRESSASITSSTASSYDSRTTLTQNSELSDSAIMNRLRKSFEQKEEFLRRPSQPYNNNNNNNTNYNNSSNSSNNNSLSPAQPPSAFYSRPKRLQKQMWPPMTLTTAAIVATNCDQLHQQPIYDVPPTLSSASTSPHQQQIFVEIPPQPKYPQTQHMTTQQLLKEQFLNGISSGGNSNVSSQPTTPTLTHSPTTMTSAMTMKSFPTNCELAPLSAGEMDEENDGRPPVPHGLRIVSEKTKLFESGRPLSPDGVDRELLYKSELSR
jgi:hypothetical protein